MSLFPTVTKKRPKTGKIPLLISQISNPLPNPSSTAKTSDVHITSPTTVSTPSVCPFPFAPDGRSIEIQCGDATLQPLYGISDIPSVSIFEALTKIECFVPHIEKYATEYYQRNLNATDEAAAIYLYTIEWPKKENSLYYILNSKLHERDRRVIKPFFPFLKLLLSGLNNAKIHHNGVVWRGTDKNLQNTYKKGDIVYWWSFSSCTLDGQQINQFMGNVDKTMFRISCKYGANIQDLSAFSTEAEVLLLPMVLVVKECFTVGTLVYVELEELHTLL